LRLGFSREWNNANKEKGAQVFVAWMSAEAVRLVGADFLDSITQDDLLPEYQESLRKGWMRNDGAILLRAFHASYHGNWTQPFEMIDYEIAVNGRGIPDMDLQEKGTAQVERLLRRGVAFARAALYEQRRELPDDTMGAYVSAAPIWLDPENFTGNVTFCGVGPNRPTYMDPARLTDDIVVALFTEDCEKPLPVG
jgi:hypothetical protein